MERHTFTATNLLEQPEGQLKSKVFDCRMSAPAPRQSTEQIIDQRELYVRHLIMQAHDAGAEFAEAETLPESTLAEPGDDPLTKTAKELASLALQLGEETGLSPMAFLYPDKDNPAHERAAVFVAIELAGRTLELDQVAS